jgi:hypothetical protein
MTVKYALMVGTALWGFNTLAAAAALAEAAPQVHVLAKRDGVAVKSAMRRSPHGGSVTYTFSVSVSTSISTSADYKVKTPLKASFLIYYTGTVCQSPLHEKFKIPRTRTAYAKISKATETSSLGCPNGPSTFYGDAYDLQTRHAIGKTDRFDSTLTAKFKQDVLKIDMQVSVAIGP